MTWALRDNLRTMRTGGFRLRRDETTTLLAACIRNS